MKADSRKRRGDTRMKAIVMTLALSVVAVAGLMAQAKPGKALTAPTLKCTRADGGACTSRHVADLATAVSAAAKGSRPGLAAVNTLSLASADGTLTCQQRNGAACTAEQGRWLREVAAT